jgi:hypothetical protein
MIEHTIFEHPLNGHRETVSRLSHLWMLLFGIFYLMMKGLWPHVAVWVMIALFTMAAPIFGITAALIAWIVYAVMAPSLIAANYRRKGWRAV